jgi:uncharacterized protein involved in exopolysaccharide biosynthesis
MTNELKKTQKQIQDDEIDLIALTKSLWKGRPIMIKSMLIFGMIGFFIAIFSPREFTARTVIVPQVGDGQSKLGGLSSLAAMAGFNINMGTAGSELSPTIYPQIVASIPFQLELMNTPLKFRKFTNPVTLFEYYTKLNNPSLLGNIKKYTIGLPGVIITAIKGKASMEGNIVNGIKQPLQLTEDQRDVLKIIAKLVSLEVNAKEGYLTLTTKMPEAIPAAQLAQRAQELLQQYIIEFKVKKTKANLDFIQQRYEEAKQKFEEAQQRLAQLRDRNKNVTSASARTEEERLISQYNLIYGVYSDVAKQFEQAKIQVKLDTPVFTIIEPASVPTEKSKPKSTIILIVWLFFGCIVGAGIIFGKQYLQTIKERWKEEG